MKVIRVFLSVLFGVYFTHFAIEATALTPVLASALVGLLGSIAFVKKWNIPNDIGAAIYCGSFVGMGSALTTVELLPASIVATILMAVSTNIFKGFGGKLGFTAFVASIVTGLGIALVHQTFSVAAILNGFQPFVEIESIVAIVVAVITGFYSTVYINHQLNKSAVLASAFPSFVIGFLGYTNLPFVELFVATFFSASFAGMLAETLLPKRMFPILVLVLSVITIVLKTMLGNFGGSLGTMAFIAVSIIVIGRMTQRK